MKTEISRGCYKCYLAKEILGNYVCDSTPEEGCPESERLKLIAQKEAYEENEKR